MTTVFRRFASCGGTCRQRVIEAAPPPFVRCALFSTNGGSDEEDPPSQYGVEAHAAAAGAGADIVVSLGPEDPPRGRLCNAIMAAKPGSVFVRAWLDEYEEHFNSDGWGEASVDLPYCLYERLSDEHCTAI